MLEQLYADFTNKVLPMVAEGLTMTKDYFFDLFGRYVQYLILTDILTMVAGVASSIVMFYFASRLYKFGSVKKKDRYDREELTSGEAVFFSWVFRIIAVAMLVASITVNTYNIIKAVYIPEIRIYEELKSNNVL